MTTHAEDSTPKRVCLLTGAGGELGTVLCRRLRRTYNVVAVYRSHIPDVVNQHACLVDPLAPQRDLPANRDGVHVVQGDLTCDEDVRRVVDVALARFGRIDLLVNGAARMGRGPVLDDRVFVASLADHLEVNVLAPARLTIAVARTHWQDDPATNRTANRNVVNVSSSAGVYVYPGLGHGAYGTSKAALNLLTVHLADELAVLGVRANTLAPTTFPGLIATESVCDAIVRLDQGSMSGRLLLLDKDGPQWL